MQRIRVELFDLLGVEANVLLRQLLLEPGTRAVVVVAVAARIVLAACVRLTLAAILFVQL